MNPWSLIPIIMLGPVVYEIKVRIVASTTRYTSTWQRHTWKWIRLEGDFCWEAKLWPFFIFSSQLEIIK